MRDAAAEVIYHRLKYFLSPQLDLYWHIRDVFALHAGKPHVLDYGCGTGVGTLVLSQGDPARCVGIDVDAPAVRFAAETWGHLATFVAADWSELRDWQNERLVHAGLVAYDLIACVEVIEHADNHDALLQAFRANLAANGVLVISTLNHNSQYRKNAAHRHGFHVADFRALLRKHFGNVRLTDYTLRGPESADDSTITPVVAVCKS